MTAPMNPDDLAGFVATVAETSLRLQAALVRLAEEPKAVGVRHAARKLQAALQQVGVECLDLSGKPYDEGLAVDVVEMPLVEMPNAQWPMPNGRFTTFTIDSMVFPILLWNGIVIRRGEVILIADHRSQIAHSLQPTVSTPPQGESCSSDARPRGCPKQTLPTPPLGEYCTSDDPPRGCPRSWQRALSHRRLAARIRNRKLEIANRK